jgi:cysteine desulfurase
MYVNNELGTLNPIKAIAALLKTVNRDREPNDRIQLHVDASQGLLFNDVQEILEVADYVSLSGHKIYGPKGIGLLYSRTDINTKPMFYGGGQEFGKRSGTHNVPAIVGLSQAVKNLAEYKKSEGEIRKIRDYIADELGKINGVVINTPYADKVQATSYHLNLALPGKSAEDSVLLLDMQGFAISAGSACSSKSIKSSHVMRAITDVVEVQNNSIRISCGLYSTMEAAEELVNAIKAWY